MLSAALGSAWRTVPTVEEPSSQAPFTPTSGAHRDAGRPATSRRTGSIPEH